MNWTEAINSKLSDIGSLLKQRPVDWKTIEEQRKQAESLVPPTELLKRIEPGESITYMDPKRIAITVAFEDLESAIREMDQAKAFALVSQAQHDLGF